MRKLIISLLALVGIFGGVSAAQAVTFDGQNFSPSYTTGITEVTFVSDQGIQHPVPVWSMEPCTYEDGTGQEACVWYAPSQGNGTGAFSFIKLGGGQTATISNEAAGVLLVPGILPNVEYVEAPILTEPVQANTLPEIPLDQPVQAITPVVPEYVSDGTSEGVVVPDPANIDAVLSEADAEMKIQACEHEDGSGQPGEQDCIWASELQGNGIGETSVLYESGETRTATYVTNEWANAHVIL